MKPGLETPELDQALLAAMHRKREHEQAITAHEAAAISQAYSLKRIADILERNSAALRSPKLRMLFDMAVDEATKAAGQKP